MSMFKAVEGLTQEQLAVVEASRSSKRLKVEALAGTGKTTVLVAIARDIKTRKPISRILYTAFNRMVVNDVADKIRRFADCATVHSLALQSVGSEFVQWKFNNNPRRQRPMEAAEILGISSSFHFDARLISRPSQDSTVRVELRPGQQFRLIRQCVESFTRSPDQEIGIEHVADSIFAQRYGGIVAIPENVKRHVVVLARDLWEQTIRPNTSRFEFDHSHYMKMWHLSDPTLPYDTVLFDEAQDADPLMRDIVERHQGQVIWCGDRFQSIYSWRGAVNAMEQVKVNDTLYLTQSFRFGPAVAEVANSFLKRLGGRPILGKPDVQSSVGRIAAPTAELYRLNVTVLIRFVELMEQGERPTINIDLVTLGARITALRTLLRGEHSNIPEFEVFEDLADLISWLADEDVDPGEFELTMRRLIRLEVGSTTLCGVDDVNIANTLTWLGVLEKAIDAARDLEPSQTGRLLSTVHRVKGLQFESVYVADDFPTLETEHLMVPSVREHWHLGYVAVTRARFELEHNFDYVAQLPIPSLMQSPVVNEIIGATTMNSSAASHQQTPKLFQTAEPIIKVVGTSYKQAELHRIAQQHADVKGLRRVVATLRHELDNSFDTNAVLVSIDGLPVGYLPKEFAPIVVERLNGQSFNCEAVVRGGHVIEQRRMNYGVDLAFGWSND
ncbi:MAG: hypothetical protein FJW98_08055 [Actinobacteria bacterium]|nr:hypothetical protein [Actinomycetota bacterium]